MLIDKTGKFEVLASKYAKTIVRDWEAGLDSPVVVSGYRWDTADGIDYLLWFVDDGGESLITLHNETEAEEW
tara:strand:+ start:140 stop:355 length:216 start_codon:yes stop_codon:yes gene_type:complete